MMYKFKPKIYQLDVNMAVVGLGFCSYCLIDS